MKMLLDVNKDVVLLSVVIAEFIIIVLLLVYICRRCSNRAVCSSDEKESLNAPNLKVSIFDKILQFWSGLVRQYPVFQMLTMKDIVSLVQGMPAYKYVQSGSKKLYFVRVSAEKIPDGIIPSTELKNHDLVGLFVVADLNGTPEQVCHVIFWEKMSDELEGFLKEGNDALELCV